MATHTLQFDAPQTINLADARFGVASGLIYQGAVSLKDALQIAGMERRDFIDAMLDLGGKMAEAIEDAVDVEASREAVEEMKRLGLKGTPLEDFMKKRGIKLED
jgi:predicted HTH domain antitoxin